ncbi:MAG TPA: PaaI family thioesterase [Deltaproteobacteria bacterium]|nr:PaaI family thioesterase [Deltaproteobacteria bacterium]HPR54670.1 PaaI family thioesterase [Deltaproteobacteria bacterium]HXK46665.1 PaaI family thioesterase [Deltaproteobacteria bacterium]
MKEKAFQELYPDELSHCYGCGRLNEHGLHIRSYWEGDESVALFTPRPYHMGMPGFVYGGLIASLIDCHSTGTASAADCRMAGYEVGSGSAPRYVTASLHVDYLRPTPLGVELTIRGKVEEISERKIIVTSTVSANGIVCAKGRLVSVKIPATMSPSRTDK